MGVAPTHAHDLGAPAEAIVRAGDAPWSVLFDAAPDGVVVAGDGEIRYANAALVELLGFDRADELVGTPLRAFVPAEDLARVVGLAATLAGTGALGPVQARLLDAGGELRTVEVRAKIVQLGGAPEVLAFVRDTAPWRRMQSQIVQAERLATLGTVAAGVAHEVNNPLAYASLNLGFVERELRAAPIEGARAEELRAALDGLRDGIDRIACIVRDLQRFARTDDDAPRALDAREVLDAAIHVAMSAIRPKARLVRRYEPAPRVRAGSARLGQVCLDLLLNAAQALPDEGPDAHEIVVTVRPATGDRVEIAIADDGPGIPPALRDKVFEPFFTTRPAGVARGLGLSICQSLVASFGGEIALLDPARGRGLVARVLLPAAPAEPADEAPPATPVSSAVCERRLRVLLVDDEQPLLRALARALSSDCEVTCASGGDEAIAIVRSGASFDAILCDVLMPGTSGIEVYAALAAERPASISTLAFMTGAASDPRVSEFLGSISCPWVEKPISAAAVLDLVRRRAAAGAASAA